MALISDVLFPAADYRRTTYSLLSWWESRRLTYNVCVGGAGLFTLLVLRLISWLPPGVPMVWGWLPIVAYGVLANVCYSFGALTEITAQRVWKEKTPAFGPALFRQGLAFSVGLTLLPILIVSGAWVLRAGAWLFGALR